MRMGLFKRRSKDLFTIPETGAADTGADFGDFRMTVEDVFVITGRGTVVTGMVVAGAVAVGARVTIERPGRPPLAAEVAGIEMFRRKTNRAAAGDNVGLLFRGVFRGEIAGGDVVRAA